MKISKRLQKAMGWASRKKKLERRDDDTTLEGDIRNQKAVFLCVQTQAEARWGLLQNIMSCLSRLGLEVIDHRTWHPRGVSATLVNEVYCKDTIEIVEEGTSEQVVGERIKQIRMALEKTIDQPNTSKVNVQRWIPGVVEEVIESSAEEKPRYSLTLEERLLREASAALDKRQSIQTTATKEKTVDEILMQNPRDYLPSLEEDQATTPETAGAPPQSPRRRRRKMRSTPAVVGGDMFGGQSLDGDFGSRRGHKAEIIVQGETYDVMLSDEVVKALRTGFSGDVLDRCRGMSMLSTMIQPDTANVANRLHGFVRTNEIAEYAGGGTTEKDKDSVKDGTETETSSTHHNDAESEDQHEALL